MNALLGARAWDECHVCKHEDHLPSLSSSHPGSRSSGSKRGCNTQSAGTHGEVADQVPYQAGDLNEGREQGENRAVELCVKYPVSQSH